MSASPKPLKNIRVRFAPSPTGPLHMGGVRTALFNYLFAKKYGGRFILRIEDTDPQRSKKEWENDLLKSLEWLGILWDEGPCPSFILEKSRGIADSSSYIGDYGPYRQSERKEVYVKYLKRLVEEEKAYYCFCSKEELEAYKEYLMSIGQPPIYQGRCRNLSKEKVNAYLRQKRPFVIRFKTPSAQKIIFEDLVRGKIEFDSSLLGDFVIAKDFYTPLYNFSCAVDDFEMGISHIIRGEEHISNTPKQILLQKALSFPQLEYAHLPLILGPDRKKLSKRHGAASISDWRNKGYLPKALINFIAFLGWNPGTEKETYSLSELIEDFSIEKIQKGGAIFDINKLDWLNGIYVRKKSADQVTQMCLPYLENAGLLGKTEKTIKSEEELLPVSCFLITKTGEEVSQDKIEKIISLYQERLRKFSDITSLIDFFFVESLEYEKGLLKWKNMSDRDTIKSLDKCYKILSKIKEQEFNKESIEKSLLKQAEKMQDRGYLLWPLRVALTGKQASAGPFEIAEILGKEKTLKRIKKAKEKIK